MKIINIPQNERAGSCYSCQKFQDDFKYYIDNQYKFCGVRCLLKYYPNNVLKIIWAVFLEHIPTPKNRSSAIIILSKEMEVQGW